MGENRLEKRKMGGGDPLRCGNVRRPEAHGKGQGAVAEKIIIEIARRHDIPVREDRPSSRS